VKFWSKPTSAPIAASSVTMPPDVVKKITCENAGKFYGLMT
jgi:hypothetical protein